MIDRAEILAVASDLSLAPDVVEKDYVLGWLLAGVHACEALADAWVFKGGTCLKKCFFETYRFSEDLDFTITDETQLEAEFLTRTFGEVATWVYDQSGIEIPNRELRFNVYRNHRDRLSCEGRVYYRGPLRRSGSLSRIKLDLTVDELLVLPAVERLVVHPYSDHPADEIAARCYAYEEIFGEKVRALAERTRPRDLYDVINLFRNSEFRPEAAAVLEVLRKKCAFKGIPVPTFASIATGSAELIADWSAMLGHQLPVLPPFETFWDALPEFFTWLEVGAVPERAKAAQLSAGEELYRPAVGALRRQGIGGSSTLEAIRFAAANRLCVDLTYQGEVRRIEPYSFRRTIAGDILLHAVRRADGEPRTYRLDRIERVKATDEGFTPRYEIEISPAGFGSILPTKRGATSVLNTRIPPPRLGSRPIARRTNQKHGPVYVYQCSYCQKKFSHRKMGGHLHAHKSPQGFPCSGRSGSLVETKY